MKMGPQRQQTPDKPDILFAGVVDVFFVRESDSGMFWCVPVWDS
jgi:hypothetical protein